MTHTNYGSLIAALGLATGVVVVTNTAQAQDKPANVAKDALTVFHACYVPTTGLLYRIKAEGLPETCRAEDHVAFSWSAAPAVERDTDPPAPFLAPAVYNNDDGAAWVGTLQSGIIAKEGAGVRMLWYPKKAAFRVGEVTGKVWNDNRIGFRSFAMGLNTLASRSSSMALGSGTQAKAPRAVAIGFLAEATGENAIALGNATTAGGKNATAMGYETNAGGENTTAMGHQTIAVSDHSTAMGDATQASGPAATAMGSSTWASGAKSTAMGFRTTAQPYASLVLGQYNEVSGNLTTWVNTDPLLVAGNGTSFSNQSNALTLFKNGNLTAAGTVESENGGFKFPDGTVQTTAANNLVIVRRLKLPLPLEPGKFYTGTVDCEPGELAVSGGWGFDDPFVGTRGFKVIQSAAADHDSWLFTFYNDNTGIFEAPINLSPWMHVNCLKLSS